MYPFIDLFGFVKIYSFWVALTVSFFLFVWMLKRLSIRIGYDFWLFKKNALWFVLSVFGFSRLFYMADKWSELKYIEWLSDFFVMNDYNLSLIWGIFWFLFCLLILLKIRKESLNRYIYWVVTSFLFVLPIAYFWALLWGQVYGIDTNIWIEIDYTNVQQTPVPFKSPIFPLPIIYSILYFLLFSGIYIWNMYIKENTFLWQLWILLFAVILFFLEFFSGKTWVFKDLINLNIGQLWAIILIWFSGYHIYKLSKIKE